MPKTKRNDSTSEDSDSGPDDRAPPKKSKDSQKSGGGAKETSWVLDKHRQVRINEFRGRKLIDIREYYEKDGKSLPGKKGISLSVSQWKNLIAVAKEISEAAEEN